MFSISASRSARPSNGGSGRSVLQASSFLLAFLFFALAVDASSLRSTKSAAFTKIADLTRPAELREGSSSPNTRPFSSTDGHDSSSFGMSWKTVDTPVVRLYDGSVNQPGFGIVPTGADGKAKQLPFNASGIFPTVQGNTRRGRRASKHPSKSKPKTKYPGKSTFSPLNPPSIPLIVKGPYLNAWLPSGSDLDSTPPNKEGNGGYLAGQYPAFWTTSRGADGEFRLGIHGYIRIDGTTYQFMGNGFGNLVRAGENANQLSFEYTATRSIFRFEASGILFNVTFLTPITPDDYLRQSIPASYVHFELDQLSAKNHKVQLFMDIDERWVTGHDYDWENYPTTLDYSEHNGTQQYFLTLQREQEFTEFRQRAEWGSSSFAIRSRPGVTSINQNNIFAHQQFINDGALTNEHNPVGGPDNSFAFAVDFNVANSPADAVFSIGHFRTPYVNFAQARNPGDVAGKSDQEPQYGYWQSGFSSLFDTVAFFLHDFDSALKNAIKFDQKIHDDSKAAVGGGDVGDQYAAITTLSARQSLATIEITLSKDKDTGKYSKDPYIFLKEISSNGDMQTVDVIFPQFPLLTYLNPDLLRRLLDPIFDYVASGLYPNKWCIHDLGTYPNGVGHPDGRDEPMPLEESGNMIIMVLHWAQLVGKDVAVPYLKKRYSTLAQWASFLISESLIPAAALSTDDFAGTASNQTNLAIKGITGLAAMANIADLIGSSQDAAIYRNISQEYVSAWHFLSVDKQKTHTKLLYQEDNSWGTLYNLFADRLLNLNLVPKSVYDMQDAWYPQVVEKYGVPLDSRHKWAKTDWAIFTAAASQSSSTRDSFISHVYKFVSNGLTDVPFTDLYETTTGDLPKYPYDPTVSFFARPVVGGHFAQLAKLAADKTNTVTQYKFGAEPAKTSYTDKELDKLIKDSIAMESKLSTAGTTVSHPGIKQAHV
ncbi:unnamed protein product [Tilletia controversa]|uniref:Glutaminase n=1 Tax=Tilletia controversa TaxID=13291 RepID=A0A8X7MY44_9BASI|nr:hypothetical protein A4X06_0g1626 [Tilletia controversa]CAD6923402.1 unnamed protein product [Tilletia controversa]CAD6942411.1 unnamed protein product [Tilletia controversa]CAD6986428.1 unnamed protein product [Tilletia controversa]